MKKKQSRLTVKRVPQTQSISPELAYIPTTGDVDSCEPIDLDKPDLPSAELPGVYLVTPNLTLEQAKELIKKQGFLYNSLPDYLKTSEVLELANEWWINHVGNELGARGNLPQQHCLRCNHQWVPRKMDIRFCPKCHSGYWDRPFPAKKQKAKPIVKKKSFPITKIVRRG